MSSTNRNTGFIVALACGVLGLLAFFAFPFVSIYGVSVTALTIATTGAQFSSGAAILWVEAVLAGLITGVAALQFSKSASASRKKAAGGWLLALGIIGVVLCVVFIVILSSASSNGVSYGGFAISLLGLGFWAFFISVIGTIVGGVMAMKQAAQIVPGASMSSSYTQYPGSQPPPMQQYMSNLPSSPQYPPYQQPSSPQYPPYQQPSGQQYSSQDYPPSAGGQS